MAKSYQSKAKVYRTGKGYYHSYDPYTLHSTQAGAKSDMSRMSKLTAPTKIRKPRETTFYTILQDKRKGNPRKYGNVPQGPHTFPHFAIHYGISEAKRQKKLNVLAALVNSPSSYNKRVDGEIPVGHAKRERAEVAQDIYAKRHAKFTQLKKLGNKRSETQEITFAHTINKLLQQDPFGSYAYKGRGAGKGALSGKGESHNKPLDQQIDLPSKHGFNDIKGVTTRNQTLLNTIKPFLK